MKLALNTNPTTCPENGPSLANGGRFTGQDERRIERSDGGLLVLDRQRSTRGCPTPRVVHGREFRCKRRSCRYCMGRKNRVLGRMLVSDAKENEAPTHLITLTTLDPEITSETFRRGVGAVALRLRQYAGRFEYFLKVEFTTGRSARSGGHRRVHAHLCAKGLAGHDLIVLEGIVRETWQRVVGAQIIEVAEMITPHAALHYLGIHHGKMDQQPPAGWRGMTERWSQGYLSTPVPEWRERAEDSLAAEGYAWSTGCSDGDAVFAVSLWRAERRAARLHAAKLREETAAFVDSREPAPPSTRTAPASRLVGVNWDDLHHKRLRVRPARKRQGIAAYRISDCRVRSNWQDSGLGSQAWLATLRCQRGARDSDGPDASSR